MITIETRRADKEIFGLVISPEEGELLTGEQLEKLLPYVLRAVVSTASSAMADKIRSKLVVSSQNLSFRDLSEVDSLNVSKLLDIVVSACDSLIKEVLIVPQSLGTGFPTIRHRVMNFKANEGTGIIEVKYTELGVFNNFDAAMQKLASHYPDVERAKTNETSLVL